MSMKPPDYTKDNIIMQIAWRDFMSFAWAQDEIHQAFQSDTGTKRPPKSKSPIEAMVDNATGFEEKYMTAFVEWVTENHWNGKPETQAISDGEK